MKLQFKVQQYQTDAVNSVVGVFAGQPYCQRDRSEPGNAPVVLSPEQLLNNIRQVQRRNNIRLSDRLVDHLGACSLDVEMETGTGKTYVYIKTIFELNKRYGWGKFIVVVPSLAIREGVKKSFEITQDHFMEHYQKKARFFVYDSRYLTELDHFSSGSGINVMIINIQAFNTSMKDGARSKEARRIYEKLDDFGSRRPIDVLQMCRPILILDEPQKMGGDKTQRALAHFNPLFCLNYSATHTQHHNLVYVLDAVDAYNKRLVKKIEVKGLEIKNLRGADRYLFLEAIILSPSLPPRAKIELEVRRRQGIKRQTRILSVGADLYEISNYLEQYKGYRLRDIDPVCGTVTFINGVVLAQGEVVGDVSERDLRRIQIRETIVSHLEKEKRLFELGIKTLSLFFIDEVAKYRRYNEAGEEVNSEYGQMFEEEYIRVLQNYLTEEDTPYMRYLRSISPQTTHAGYFSIDRHGRKVNSPTKRGSDVSDDIAAYDLILKDKERLLSLAEPVRFIFSHSALREGWDNPNVFQICTLKHGGGSPTQKRQEVGRGLRLCVNQQGERMDEERCGDLVHVINLLTVIASEGYRNFVADLQTGIKETLYDRPSRATPEYFAGKSVMVEGQPVVVSVAQAEEIYRYLKQNGYIDGADQITEFYQTALEEARLAPLPESLRSLDDGVHYLIQSVFDKSVLERMVVSGNRPKILEHPPDRTGNGIAFEEGLNGLKGDRHHSYPTAVAFDSEELVQRAIRHLNRHLQVAPLQYTVTTGRQLGQWDQEDIVQREGFDRERTKSETLNLRGTSETKYDLIGMLAEGTVLTRRTVAAILAGLEKPVLDGFAHNPEEFITKAIRLIKEQKAAVIRDKRK